MPGVTEQERAEAGLNPGRRAPGPPAPVTGAKWQQLLWTGMASRVLCSTLFSAVCFEASSLRHLGLSPLTWKFVTQSFGCLKEKGAPSECLHTAQAGCRWGGVWIVNAGISLQRGPLAVRAWACLGKWGTPLVLWDTQSMLTVLSYWQGRRWCRPEHECAGATVLCVPTAVHMVGLERVMRREG